MSDNKMLQAILDRVSLIDRKVDKGFSEVKSEIRENRNRIDKIGLDLAELSDDAPTVEEFDNLEKSVTKVEKVISI